MSKYLLASLLIVLPTIGCAKTPAVLPDSPGIRDLKILSSKVDPPALSFSLVVEPGKGKIAPDHCVWVGLGSPSAVEQVKDKMLANQPKSDRPLGMFTPEFAIEPCTMTIGKGNVWTGKVEFKEMKADGPNVAVSIFLLDDDGKPSNQLNVAVDLKSGTVSEVVAKEGGKETKPD